MPQDRSLRCRKIAPCIVTVILRSLRGKRQHFQQTRALIGVNRLDRGIRGVSHQAAFNRVMVLADRPGASGPKSAVRASQKSPVEMPLR